MIHEPEHSARRAEGTRSRCATGPAKGFSIASGLLDELPRQLDLPERTRQIVLVPHRRRGEQAEERRRTALGHRRAVRPRHPIQRRRIPTECGGDGQPHHHGLLLVRQVRRRYRLMFPGSQGGDRLRPVLAGGVDIGPSRVRLRGLQCTQHGKRGVLVAALRFGMCVKQLPRLHHRGIDRGIRRRRRVGQRGDGAVRIVQGHPQIRQAGAEAGALDRIGALRDKSLMTGSARPCRPSPISRSTSPIPVCSVHAMSRTRSAF